MTAEHVCTWCGLIYHTFLLFSNSDWSSHHPLIASQRSSARQTQNPHLPHLLRHRKESPHHYHPPPDPRADSPGWQPNRYPRASTRMETSPADFQAQEEKKSSPIACVRSHRSSRPSFLPQCDSALLDPGSVAWLLVLDKAAGGPPVCPSSSGSTRR